MKHQQTLTCQAFGDASKTHIVLIHGWGNHAGVWQPLVEKLQKNYCLHVIDLPGYGKSPITENAWQENALVDALIKTAPDNAVWCGWSLGGMLASSVARKLSEQNSEQPQALITIGTNPKFVQDNRWPHGMAESVFQAFTEGLHASPERTLKRFQNLMAKGGAQAKMDLQIIKEINAEANIPSIEVLEASLELLNSLDVRDAISNINCPQLHVLGEHDALVPEQVKQDIQSLNNNADVKILPATGHVPHISQPKELAHLMGGFLKERVMKEEMKEPLVATSHR